MCNSTCLFGVRASAGADRRETLCTYRLYRVRDVGVQPRAELSSAQRWVCAVLTSEPCDVHLREVARLEHDDGEPVGCRLVAQRYEQLAALLVAQLHATKHDSCVCNAPHQNTLAPRPSTVGITVMYSNH